MMVLNAKQTSLVTQEETDKINNWKHTEEPTTEVNEMVTKLPVNH